MRSTQRMRQYVMLAIRSVAVTLVLIGVYGMVQALLLWGAYQRLMIQYESGFTWIGFALGFLAAGVALGGASGRLMRWLMPPVRNECPQCGYALKNLASERCPECGLSLRESRE